MSIAIIHLYETLKEKFGSKEAEVLAGFIDVSLQSAKESDQHLMSVTRENELKNLASKEDLKDVKLELKKDLSELKNGVSDLKLELKQDISNIKLELKHDISDLKLELKQDISDLKLELKQDISDLQLEVKKDISDLKSEVTKNISDLKLDFKKDVSELGNKIISSKAETIRWMFALFITMLVTFLSLLLRK